MVTVYYFSSWESCFIHTVYEDSWKSFPMLPHLIRRGWYQISLDSLDEFAFNDGLNHWDNPSPGENYKALNGKVLAVYRGAIIIVEPTTNPILLISDLDNTLIGSTEDAIAAHNRFNEYWIQKHYFGDSKLVYNTGRSLAEYFELLDKGHMLLYPDMIIGALGSDAYTIDYTTGEYINHIDFHTEFHDKNWNPEIINNIIQQKFPWLIIPSPKNAYSNSVWVTAKLEDINMHRHELIEFLKNPENEVREGEIVHSRAIISGYGDSRFIDITPRNGGKRIGVRYAQQYFKFPSNKIIVAGDSGNDIEMFRDDHFGIVVENADQDITNWLTKKSRINKIKSEFKWAHAIVNGIEQIFYKVI